MASNNQVILSFAGDAGKLDKTFKDVGAGATTMGNKVDRQSDKLNRLGEAGGNTETSMLGLGAGISGVSTIMSGDAGPEDYAMALADMGDSIEHFVIPALQKMRTAVLVNIADAIRSAATHAASAATTVAGWVATGAAALVSGAQMAAAWLIGLGPIALVILAIGAVIGILVALGVGFDDVANVAKKAWSFITSAASGAKDWLARNWPLVLAILTGPFGLAVLAIGKHKDSILTFMKGIPGAVTGFFSGLADIIKSPFSAAFRAIKSAWNNTVGGFGFSTPGWLPGLGGKSFRIPEMHTGGIVSGAPGSDQLRMLQAGERVIPANRAGMGSTFVFNIGGSLVSERELIEIVHNELGRGGFDG